MSGNSIGKSFTLTTFGESHGVALGGVVDGCPPGYVVMRRRLAGGYGSPQTGAIATHDATP